MLAVVLLSIAAFLMLSQRSLPSFQGISLDHWLERGLLSDPNAELAIRSIGSNALPFLVNTIRRKDATFTIRLNRLISWQKVIPELPMVSDKYPLAYSGFKILGVSAEPAIPELSVLLYRAETSRQAAMALAAIGTTLAQQVLVRTLSNTNPEIQFSSAVALAQVQNPRRDTVTALTNLLIEPDTGVRCAAIYALRACATEYALYQENLVS
jgi:hypothetical protein